MTLPIDPNGAPKYRLETHFDRANRRPLSRAPRKKLLYHYTDWDAAIGLLSSQRVWATAHDCTNDRAELSSADDVIADVLRSHQAVATGIARRMLDYFVPHYDSFRIGAAQRTYLACFSELKDDARQWWCYGDHGEGVCLGLRLFGLPDPALPSIATQFMPVNYDESDLRTKVEQWFARYVGLLQRSDAVDGPQNWQLAFETFRTSASAWALTYKNATWAPEREIRMIFLVREGEIVTASTRIGPAGRTVRYLPVPVTRRSRMPVGEFIIGPNQEHRDAEKKARKLLRDAGYIFTTRKAPVVCRSTLPVIAPCKCGP